MDVADIDLVSVDHVLMTTRAVRKRFDLARPVGREVIERCIEIAVQAPTAVYSQTWHFIVMTDATQRAAVAEIYRRAGEGLRSGAFPPTPYMSGLLATSPDDKRFSQQQKMFSAGLVPHAGITPPVGLAAASRTWPAIWSWCTSI
jgi:nitroreductase